MEIKLECLIILLIHPIWNTTKTWSIAFTLKSLVNLGMSHEKVFLVTPGDFCIIHIEFLLVSSATSESFFLWCYKFFVIPDLMFSYFWGQTLSLQGLLFKN